MKASTNTAGKGFVNGTISFLSYCDYAYRSLRNSIEKQGWFSKAETATSGNGKKHVRTAAAQSKKHHHRETASSVADMRMPRASTHSVKHREGHHKRSTGSL